VPRGSFTGIAHVDLGCLVEPVALVAARVEFPLYVLVAASVLAFFLINHQLTHKPFLKGFHRLVRML